ncbi:MAG TPA: carbohydrate ABC transporter permease [Longimicrobiales bacterium]|nr:carbohydrate ABC transporter permease [Longimicrobiales bacterium]
MRRQRTIQAIALNVGMLVLALIFLLPILWMIVAATKANHQILSVPPSLVPGRSLVANWLDLNNDLPFLRNVFNSVAIASIFTLLATLVSAMGGYAFAKFRFRGRTALFLVVVAALTIPFEVRAIPQYLLIARDLRLANTWIAVILPWLAYPLGVFFMRQNMLSVPTELLEAARIDGAGEARIFAQVVLPIMRPALAAVAIVVFLFQWNDFFWPLLILTQKQAYTIPVALGTLVGLTRVSWGGIMVGTAIATVPFLLLFLFLQRYFVAGITAGAVKD